MLAVSSNSLHPLNASKHYVLARSTEIKTNLDARVPTVAISFRAGPKMWAGARPPTEKVPLELVPYCWCKHPVTPPQAHGVGLPPTAL